MPRRLPCLPCKTSSSSRRIILRYRAMTISIPEDIEPVLSGEWKRLGAPGTWWTGEERVDIARVARSAYRGRIPDKGVLSDIAMEAIQKIAVEAHTIDKAWIDKCHAQGLDPLPMVELLAIVVKVITIDTFLEGIGVEPWSLPAPEKGEPGRAVVERAKITDGWLPTRGRASPPAAFSAVAAEDETMDDLLEAMYLTEEEMQDTNITKDLHRSQIEVLAARVSYYNDCFF